MTTKVYSNYKEFTSRENKKENGVSKEFAEENKNYEVDNKTNEGCWNCSGCSYCSGCSGI